MKNNPTITHTLLFSSLLLFSACSSNTPKVEKKTLSAYNIMGIAQPSSNGPLFVVQQDQSLNYSPFVVEQSKSGYSKSMRPSPPTYKQPSQSSIEVVAYGSPNAYEQRSNFCQVDNSKITQDIEWNAKRFLGTKYVWGATGPSKFDCSGFTQWVFRDVGIKIPRVSRDQAKVGKYVNFEDLKRGDMVFFDTKKHRSGKVTHVGIYLGNGNFIHASSGAKKVVIYNFDEKPYYKERFLWGRRVVQENNYFASN